jgi:pimeloyl-ACP methyl ester carboxylesterase
MGRILVVAALIAPLTVSPAAAQAAPQGRTFDSDGVRLHYIDEGSGEPVLLIHGLAVSAVMNWIGPGVVEGLVRSGYRVVAHDSRGHGESDKLHDPSMYGSAEVDDVVRLMDHLGIDRAHVVGYSRGGLIASRLRAAHPDRVRTLTLGGYGEDVTGGGPPPLPEMADSLEAGNLAPLLRWLDQDASDEEIRQTNRMVTDANDMRAVAAAFRAAAAFPPLTAPDLAASEVPVLVLMGEDDPFVRQIDGMVAAVDGLESLIVPGAGHTDAFARPAFLTALVGFIAKH